MDQPILYYFKISLNNKPLDERTFLEFLRDFSENKKTYLKELITYFCYEYFKGNNFTDKSIESDPFTVYTKSDIHKITIEIGEKKEKFTILQLIDKIPITK